MPVITRVLIVGGGIGGPALSLSLRRHGIDSAIIERAPEYADIGAGLVLTPNGMKALAALDRDLAAEVHDSGAPFSPGAVSSFMTLRGKTLAEVDMGGSDTKWGGAIVPTLRSRVQRILLAHVDKNGTTVRTGSTLTGYTDNGSSVTAHLSDGVSLEGDLLVGADGVHSTVRRQLLADGEPRYCGYTAVLGTGPAPSAHPHGFLAYGRGMVLFAAPIGDRRLYWAATMVTPEGIWPAKDRDSIHRELLDRLGREHWHPDLVGMVADADPGTIVLTEVCDRDPVRTWSHGRVVLLGDAAHPMAPVLGQGANMALEDAVVLAHHLGEDGPLETALANYTAARGQRTARLVKQTRMMGQIGHARNPVAAWARNRMMTLMNRFADPDKQNTELFGWCPPVS